ncbi:MAG: class I SAM-dependent methyltransferase [Actinomycetota bacterium]
MGSQAGRADAALRVAVLAGRAGRNLLTDLRHGHLMVAGADNSDYRALREVFAGRVREGDVLIDVGCGRGRVLATWLDYYPDHRIVGIELNPDVAAATQQRFASHPQLSVVCGDAVTVCPPEATLLFLFNPFDRATMTRLRDELTARPPTIPPMRVLYTNAKDADLFEESMGWRTTRVPIGSSRVVPHHDLVVIDRAQRPREADAAAD